MLDQYREFRNDAMQGAKFCQKIGNISMAQTYLTQAKKWHKLIMSLWLAEKEEKESIDACMRKYGIVPEYS